MAESGDRVKIITKEDEFEGILMPRPEILDKGITVIKLDSGYNIGIETKKIKDTKVIEKFKKEKIDSKEVKPKKGLPTISILHTGGTVASKVDYRTGGVDTHFSPAELLSLFPQINDIANINSRLVSNMWSDDMRFAHYNILAKEIEKEIKDGAEGIIITHGTDTLHYSSAALAFALENINVPVIIVGAQRSSDRPSSDAHVNLVSACRFITKTDFVGVAVCMHADEDDKLCYITPACKVRKMHTSRRDTFQPIGVKPIAVIDYEKEDIKFNEKYQRKDPERKLKLKLFKDDLKIGIAKMHPNMFSDELKTYEKFDALIIEGTGLGHAPISVMDKHTEEHKKIFSELKKLSKKIPVAMSPQTIYGRVDMTVYAPGRELLGIGVLGNFADMTPETAFIKMAWLLSNHKKDLAELYGKNLRGEITKRSLPEDYFD